MCVCVACYSTEGGGDCVCTKHHNLTIVKPWNVEKETSISNTFDFMHGLGNSLTESKI